MKRRAVTVSENCMVSSRSWGGSTASKESEQARRIVFWVNSGSLDHLESFSCGETKSQRAFSLMDELDGSVDGFANEVGLIGVGGSRDDSH